MFSFFKQENFFEFFFAKLAIFLISLLHFVPFYSEHVASIFPSLTLIFLYFETLHYPDKMSYFYMLLLGIMHDFMSHISMGLSMLLHICIKGLIGSLHAKLNEKSPFLIQWLGFSCVYFIFMFAQYSVYFLKYAYHPSYLLLMLHYLLTILLYPFGHKMAVYFHRLFRNKVPHAA